MTILTNGPRLPGAQPFGALVEIELVGEDGASVAGYVTGTDEVVQSQLQFHADGKNALSSAVGEWAVDLTPNASIEPAGTVYRIVEQRGRSGSTTHIVSVPATGGPYTILECITDVPGSLPFGPLLVHLNDATDAHDASAVSVVPSASLAASTVQAALDELAAEATTEAATRSAADTAFASDLTDESVARIAADDAEEAARIDADADLLAEIISETNARIADVDTEEARALAAEAAEAALARNADNLTSGTVADARIAASIARDSEVTAAVAAEAALRETGDTTRAANQQVANYTLVLSDAGKAVEGNAAGALSLTVPPNSSVAYPTGTIIEVVQVGAGAVTLVQGSGVTITGDTVTPGEGGSLLLRKTGTNAWFSAIASVRSGTYPENPVAPTPAVAHVAGGPDVPVADGGTGASSASTARTNLGAAADAEVLKLAGDQSSTGQKTFAKLLSNAPRVDVVLTNSADEAKIQAAIDSIPTGYPTVVRIVAGPGYAPTGRIENTIELNKRGVWIECDGIHDPSTAQLKWWGTAGGTMINVSARGAGVRNVGLDANDLAATCLAYTNGEKQGYENVTCENFTGNGVVIGNGIANNNGFRGNGFLYLRGNGGSTPLVVNAQATEDVALETVSATLASGEATATARLIDILIGHVTIEELVVDDDKLTTYAIRVANGSLGVNDLTSECGQTLQFTAAGRNRGSYILRGDLRSCNPQAGQFVIDLRGSGIEGAGYFLGAVRINRMAGAANAPNVRVNTATCSALSVWFTSDDAGAVGTFQVDGTGHLVWFTADKGLRIGGADVDVSTLGRGLKVKEGANAKQGVATLVAGTVTVANTSVTATSRIILTPQSLGTVIRPAALGVTARTAGTSFTVMSADDTDTSMFTYEIFEAS